MRFVWIYTLICLVIQLFVNGSVGEGRGEQVFGFAYFTIGIGLLLTVIVGAFVIANRWLRAGPVAYALEMFLAVLICYNLVGFYATKHYPTLMLLTEGLAYERELPDQLSHLVYFGSYIVAIIISLATRRNNSPS
jgi:hypothetical protein